VTDCSNAVLVADCSTLTAQRKRSSVVQLVAGCNQSLQIVAVDDLGRYPMGRITLEKCCGDAVEALPNEDNNL